jgi:hypothetical protein
MAQNPYPSIAQWRRCAAFSMLSSADKAPHSQVAVKSDSQYGQVSGKSAVMLRSNDSSFVWHSAVPICVGIGYGHGFGGDSERRTERPKKRTRRFASEALLISSPTCTRRCYRHVAIEAAAAEFRAGGMYRKRCHQPRSSRGYRSCRRRRNNRGASSQRPTITRRK